MAEGKVLHADRAGIHVLRFLGEIRCTLAPSLNRFLDQLLANGPPAGMIIDLTETVLIDSTNLGLLARLANRLLPQRITLISDREDINVLLRSMALDTLFDIVDRDGSMVGPDPDTAAEVLEPHPPPPPAALHKAMLEAHRTLLTLCKENRETFRDVVAALERDRPATH